MIKIKITAFGKIKSGFYYNLRVRWAVIILWQEISGSICGQNKNLLTYINARLPIVSNCYMMF